MRYILLVGHGNGCTGLKESTEMILGEQENLMAIPLFSNESPQDYMLRIKDAIKKAKENDFDEILILADLKGGTPCNISTIIVKEDSNLNLIAGYHLGMIIMACTSGDLSTDELIVNSNKLIEKIN
ncbi:MAG: PTS sugar transporter subunit IIA [Miniphocaeibacter sp.]|uniref:PTS sugar transporter subunit IIA n=1 Tax=Miniphocaeibacter sp. TaxID=3100973 RepID=UPI003BAEBE6B